MNNLVKWFAVTVVVFFNLTPAFAQSGVVNALNEKLIPIKMLSPDADFTDIGKLKDILKNKDFIAIGEATHGTHEFFVFKHRMLEFLVKEIGVKTLVLEADFAGTQLINDFVVNGIGTAEQSIRSMGFSGITQEFVDLANWVKLYNETQLPENKVHFYGCDMQYSIFAANKIKDYLVQHHLLTPDMEKGFNAMNKLLFLTVKEKTAIRNTVAALVNIKFSDVDDIQKAIYERTVTELQQYVEYMDAQSKMFPTKQSDIRDKYMAENCEWIYNHTQQHKIMIWAHNEHIRKSAGSDDKQRMGMLLMKRFSEKYYGIGFDFYNGKMRSFDRTLQKNVSVDLPVAKARSSGEVFSQCYTPNFILEFKSAAVNPLLNAFLNSKIQSSFFGASYIVGTTPHYVTQKLAETYDAIVFIKETNAAEDIKAPVKRP